MDALVLSGGDSQGDFEVGAVRRIFELGIHPQLIAGTSVGAINGGKLAEGEGRGTAASPSGLAGLEAIWLSLNTHTDMWIENPALDIDKLKHNLGVVGIDALVNGAGLLAGSLGLGPLGLPALVAFDWAKTAPDLQHLQDGLNQLENARSLITLDPIAARLRNPSSFDPGKVGSSGIRLLIAMVGLESGALRFVNEHGEVLEADGATPHAEPVVPSIDPACQPLETELRQAEQDVQDQVRTGSKLGLGPLIAAVDAAQRALDACQRAHHVPTSRPLVVDLPDAILASSSIPFVHPPVKLGIENYVDGGVRATAPVAAAVAAGATRVYVVLANQNVIGPAVNPITGALITSFDDENLLSIAARAGENIMPAQIEEDCVHPPSGWGATDVVVIEPDFLVHNGTTVDPGLIRIRMAHGYMRADDAHQARQSTGKGTGSAYEAQLAALTEQRNTRKIIALRRQIWQREYAANGFAYSESPDGTPSESPDPVPGGSDPSALADVRAWKRQLKVLVDQRVTQGGAVPSGPEALSDWWLRWERHQFAPTVPLWGAGSAFGTMKVNCSPTGPFHDGTTVTFTISAVDALEPGAADLNAEILLDGVDTHHTTGTGPVTLTVKRHKETTEPGVDPRGKPIPPKTVVVNPVITLSKANYATVDVELQVR